MSNKAPNFDIIINGVSIPAIVRVNLLSLSLKESVEDTAKLEFTIKAFPNFTFDKEQLKLGTDIILKLGYADDLLEVFDGEVFQIKSIFKKNVSELKVTCLDRSYLLKRAPDPHVYEADAFPNLMSVAGFIVKKKPYADAGLKLVVSPVTNLINYKLTDDQGVSQTSDTDWKMLDILSTTSNQKLFCRGHTIYMVDDDYIERNISLGSFIFNQNPTDEDLARGIQLPLLAFSPTVGGKGQREQVSIIRWDSFRRDPKSQAFSNDPDLEGLDGYTAIKVRSSTIETLVFDHVLQAGDDAQAKALVKAEMQRRADKLVIGDGVILGNPRVRYGDRHEVVVKQLGEIGFQFSGTYTITETTHKFDLSGGYSTSFKVRRPSLNPVIPRGNELLKSHENTNVFTPSGLLRSDRDR